MVTHVYMAAAIPVRLRLFCRRTETEKSGSDRRTLHIHYLPAYFYQQLQGKMEWMLLI